MSNERQPLLTEEQIQEMLEYARKRGNSKWWYFFQWGIEIEFPSQWGELNRFYRKLNGISIMDLYESDMPIVLAFLRGKTKRVLNLDRLRADVKAWVDDSERKYPEWMQAKFDKMHIQGNYFVFEKEQLRVFAFGLDSDYTEAFASFIGINPDDYFEEVEVTG